MQQQFNFNELRKMSKRNLKLRPTIATIHFENDKVMWTDAYYAIVKTVKEPFAEPCTINLFTYEPLVHGTYPALMNLLEPEGRSYYVIPYETVVVDNVIQHIFSRKEDHSYFYISPEMLDQASRLLSPSKPLSINQVQVNETASMAKIKLDPFTIYFCLRGESVKQ